MTTNHYDYICHCGQSLEAEDSTCTACKRKGATDYDNSQCEECAEAKRDSDLDSKIKDDLSLNCQ